MNKITIMCLATPRTHARSLAGIATSPNSWRHATSQFGPGVEYTGTSFVSAAANDLADARTRIRAAKRTGRPRGVPR